MPCVECGGEINTETRMDMDNMCGTFACPCKDCRRLHWEKNGKGVFHKNGQKAYLKNRKICLE